MGIQKFLRQFKDGGCLMRQLGSGHPLKMTEHVVEQQMRCDNKTTATQLHCTASFKGIQASALCCQ